VRFSAIDKIRQTANEEKMLKYLMTNFVRSHQSTCAVIKKAVDDGDIKLAYRLAHTLKSNAGQIGEKPLQKAAAAVEDALADGKNLITDAQKSLLETELNSVLEKLTPLFAEAEAARKNKSAGGEKPLGMPEQLQLLKQLESMLKNRNPQCIDLLDDIRTIPGAEELARQIEALEFKEAAAALFLLMDRR
jgi:HPt (histidine-containing phosphotransfer) domain-containing protein